MVLIGDQPEVSKKDLKHAIDKKFPIIVVEGTEFSDKIISYVQDKQDEFDDQFQEMLDKGHFYV